jgi:hypothetical protein
MTPERRTFLGAVGIGVVLFLVGLVLIVAVGGAWAALGWVLMLIVVLGVVGAVGSTLSRRK